MFRAGVQVYRCGDIRAVCFRQPQRRRLPEEQSSCLEKDKTASTQNN